MKNYLLLFLLVFLFGCNQDVNISYDKTETGGAMTFSVDNPTELNIEVLVLGFKYFDESGELIRTDTVSYRNAAEMESRVFLEANGMTWVTQMPPEGAMEAEPFVVSYEVE